MKLAILRKHLFFSSLLLILVLLVCLVGLNSTVNAQRRGPESTSPQPARPMPPVMTGQEPTGVLAEVNWDYRIAPGDVIEIKIEDAPELSRNYRVNAAGNIEMEIIGRVIAQQKTSDELARLIAGRLRKEEFLKTPLVTVTVRQFNSHTFMIQGAIQKPGVYQLEGRPSLLTMIGLAGGLAENHGSAAFILRRSKGKKTGTGTQDSASPVKPEADAQVKAELQTAGANSNETARMQDAEPEPPDDYELVKVNLGTLYKGRTEDNQRLAPGDIVNIPRADVFFVTGEVQAPGSFFLKDGTTLRQAISLAQGMNFKAKAGQGVIFREDPETGKRQEIKVDIGAVMSGKKEDLAILANDVIIVPNSRTKSVGGALLMAFGTSVARVPIR